MKNFLVLFIIFVSFLQPVLSATDKTSEDYLKTNKNIFGMSFIRESVISTAIKHALKKEAPGRYKVKFKGYTLSSIKQGIFKYLEITGKGIEIGISEGVNEEVGAHNKVNKSKIEIPYLNIKTLTNYNWIDYNQNPIVFKSDMLFDFEVHLSEKTINKALETEEYNKVLRKINKKVFPMLTLNNVSTKIRNDKLYFIIEYNFPLLPSEDDKILIFSSKLRIVNNEIQPYDIMFDSIYNNLPLQKVTRLINILNPLNFTIKLLKEEQGEVKIEEIKIIDDIVIINGKIYIKGEK